MNNNPHQLLKTKLYPKPENYCDCSTFEELNTFRTTLEESRTGLHHHPYIMQKNRIRLYQTAFFILSAVFFTTTAYLFFAHFNWIYFLLFEGSVTYKTFLCFLTGSLGATTAWIGLHLKPEIEMINYALSRATKRIKKIHSRRVSASHCAYFTSPKGICTIRNSNKKILEDLREKLELIKEEALLTTKRIMVSKELEEKQKEVLHNQNILELQQRLEEVVSAYEKNQLVPICYTTT